MPVQHDAIWAALRTVQEPELHRDLVSLNMVKDLAVTDAGEVALTVVLTTPACPLKALMERDIKAALAKVEGVTGTRVNFTSNVTGGVQNQELGKGIKNIVAVASGKGGVGKSTVSVNLAAALARSGATVGLLDADIYGPNVPLMSGLKGAEPTVLVRQDAQGNETQMIEPLEKFGIRVMSMGFLLHEDQPVMWRGPMLNSALRQFLGQVEWGDLDYLVIDLPPGTGDVQISLLQLVKVTGIVHVTTPQEVALSDVRRGISMFKSQNIPLLGIIENMSYFECPHCTGRTDVFSHGGGLALANALQIPFLGEIPLDVKVREAADSGTPIVVSAPDSPQAIRFMAAAEQLAARISVLNYERTGAVGAAV